MLPIMVGSGSHHSEDLLLRAEVQAVLQSCSPPLLSLSNEQSHNILKDLVVSLQKDNKDVDKLFLIPFFVKS
jgi:hypothetical protein